MKTMKDWTLSDLESHPIIPEPRQIELRDDPVAIPADGVVVVLRNDYEFPTIAQELEALFAGATIVTVGDSGASDAVANAGALVLVGAASANPHVAAALQAAGVSADLESDSHEAHLLDIRVLDGTPTITIAGNTDWGDFFGLQSLKQVLTPSDNGLTARGLTVRDWPSFLYRGIKRCEWWPEWLPTFKMNFMWYFARQHGWRDYITVPEGAERDALREKHRTTMREHRAAYRHVMVSYNPGGVLDLGDAHMDAMRGMLTEWYAAGLRLFAVSFDDQTAQLTPETVEKYGDYAHAHVAYVNAMYEHLQTLEAGLDLYLCPLRYASTHVRAHPEEVEELRQAGFNPGVKLQWVGPTLVAAEASREQTKEFGDAYGLRVGLFYDNWPGSHNPPWNREFGPVRNRDPELWRDIDVMMLSPESMGNRVDGFGVAQVACTTCADYSWNSEAYDPERSIARTVLENAGPEAYDALLAFVEPFTKQWLGSPNRKLPVPDSDGMSPEEVIAAFDRNTARFQELMDRMAPSLKNRLLYDDLKQWMDAVRGTYWEKMKTCSYQHYEAKQMEAPVIDGDLDEPAWENGGVVDKFFAAKGGVDDSKGTRALVGYDTENLFVGILCPRDDMDALVETDDDDWHSDNCEIFFDIKQEKTKFDHRVMIKTTGLVTLMGNDDPTAVERIEVAVKKEATRYVIEARIPFEVLGERAVSGDTWGFLITRNEFRATGLRNDCVYAVACNLVEGGWSKAAMYAELQFE